MTLLFIAFLSGILTILAPCALPLLPVILGASAQDGNNKKIPLIIIGSLSLSIIFFSLILKVSTLLIDVPPSFWKSFSGGILITLGVTTLFPNIWSRISMKMGWSNSSNKILEGTQKQEGIKKYIFMGLALGPVFSSCSPTYSLILAIILPAGFVFGFAALIVYTLGLATILLAIAIFGQELTKRLTWASNPNGIFKKVLGVIFILVGLSIFTGFDKKVEGYFLDMGLLSTTQLEQNLIRDFDFLIIPDGKIYENSEGDDTYIGGTCTDGSCSKSVAGSLSFLNPEMLLKNTKNGYKAPEINGLTNWINSDGYTSLSELKGQVIMIDFWTSGCINCIKSHESTNTLYEAYKDDGLVVLGIHAPEFAYEHKISAVQKAVTEHGITFPVVQDNDFITWKAYNNKFWPAFYIIDKKGNVRYTHFGLGEEQEKRDMIEKLLQED